jgi:hypothetical protein
MHLDDPILNGDLPLLYTFSIEASVSGINIYHIGLYHKIIVRYKEYSVMHLDDLILTGDLPLLYVFSIKSSV